MLIARRTIGRFIVRVQRGSLLALLIYLAASAGLLGRQVLPHLTTSVFGLWRDPGLFIWCLEWWPWAIFHGHNPFYSNLVWAPVGTDVTWMTSVPGLSILAAPITLTAGPVAAYNILSITGPALSAWTAYIVCYHVTRAFWPAVFGGWIYGFSSYEWNHAVWGHLFLSWALVPPLLLYITLLFLEGAIGSRRFVLYVTLALIAQFCISVEIFATVTIFGAAALLLAALLIPDLRTALFRATLLIACAYGLTAVGCSPFLYHFFVLHGVSREPIFPPFFFSNDLLSVFVPGPLNLVSRASHQLANASESEAYLGPLLALVACFALSSWRQARAKLLLIMLGLIYFASLGPTLYIMNHPTIPLPWSLITQLPVINNALPARFILFGCLAVAIIGAICMTRNDMVLPIRVVLAAAGVVFLLPHPRYLSQAKIDGSEPKFFSQHLYRRFLPPDANILIIPYSYNGDSMLWQAQAGMDFRMAQGWTGAAPTSFLRWPIVNGLMIGILPIDYSDEFRAFLSQYKVQAVVVCKGAGEVWTQTVAGLGIKAQSAGDVQLYLVPEHFLKADRDADLDQIERKADAAWMMSMLTAAARYMASDSELKLLSPARAVQLGLLPPGNWAESLEAVVVRRRMGGPSLWLGRWQDDTVGIALVGSPAGVLPLISQYAKIAAGVYFPYPHRFADNVRVDDTPEILLMVFGREGLARTASQRPARSLPQSSAALQQRLQGSPYSPKRG